MKRGKPAPIPNGAKVHPMVYLQRMKVEKYMLQIFVNSYYQANMNANGTRKGKLPMQVNPN